MSKRNENLEAAVETVENVEPVVEATITEPVVKEVTGVVANCVKLNIRRRPRVANNVVDIVSARTKLVIDPDKSTDEWFKVRTESGVEGFCMKKYVSVKQ